MESRNLIPDTEYGFDQQSSALDHLVNLVHEIQNLFLLRHRLVVAILHAETVFDTTWRYGILRTYHQCNLSDRLPLFISNILHHRYFRARLHNCYLRDTVEKMDCHRDVF
jgi:hypothetical protein